MEIQLIKREDIDKTKWNSCVHYASNGNIFGYKWYLDSITKEWDGLVEGDYESVLPIFKAADKNTLKQPDLIREAGIYSISVLSKKRILAFLEAIPANYQNIQLQINEGIQKLGDTGFEITKKVNYQLLMMRPYEEIRENYTQTLKSALKDSHLYKLKTASSVKPEHIADLFKVNNPDKDSAFHAYHRIMYNALHRGWGFASGIINEQEKLITAAFFVFSHGKGMALLAPESIEGKAKAARALLLDFFIRQNAGRPLILDFNTDLDFPLDFGAQKNTYQSLSKVSKKWWKVF